jgi:hypothetical protein
MRWKFSMCRFSRWGTRRGLWWRATDAQWCISCLKEWCKTYFFIFEHFADNATVLLPHPHIHRQAELGSSAEAEKALWLPKFTIYNLKLSRWLNSIKSSQAHSCVNWLQVETNVSGTISVPIIRVYDDVDTNMSWNVSFYLQPTDAAVCPRRFY